MAAGKLRSRQRQTHDRMVEAIPPIVSRYAVILKLMHGQIPSPSDSGAQSKTLNQTLKLCQNLAANASKNRWLESVSLVQTET